MSLDKKVLGANEDFFISVKEYERASDCPEDPDDIVYFRMKILEAIGRSSKEKRQ